MTANNSGLFEVVNKEDLEAVLPQYVRSRRWFGGKARIIGSVEMADLMPVEHDGGRAYVAILRLNYEDGGYQHYVLPLGIADGFAELTGGAGEAVIMRQVNASTEQENVFYDATFNPGFTKGLLAAIEKEKRFSGPSGEIVASRTRAFEELGGNAGAELTPSLMGAEQSNTSIRYDRTFILKLFRRLEEGISPDLEIGRFLGEAGFKHTPPLAGALEYHREGEPLTLAILQGFVPNQGDAWSFTLRMLEEYYLRTAGQTRSASIAQAHLLNLANTEVPAEAADAIGEYLGWARLLGRRTAELHIALASDPSDPPFAPEPYTPEYQREMHASMSALTDQAFRLLRGRLGDLPSQTRDESDALLARQGEVAGKFGALQERPLAASRTRCHGDYHLGQVLFTGGDFMIIDFEGEPVRSLAERRLKHSPLKDVAGMLRSFHYAAYSGLFDYQKAGGDTDATSLERLADAWQLWVSAAYLREYLQTTAGADFLPRSRDDLQIVLDAHLLEKAVYELIYELNNRPDWVMIPLKGILYLLS
jgi:maltose alpha-D-glucosyltransferase/alpha-amylase